MEIFSCEEMKRVEEETIKNYIPSIVLMENAAEKVVQVIKEEYKDLKNRKILVICGHGNNGGDGFAIARKLLNISKSLKIYFAGESLKLSDDAGINYRAVVNLGIEFITQINFSEFDVIIDALFGTGLSREISGNYKDIIEKVNESGKNIVSVDIPSGIDGNSGRVMGCAVKADITVTFQRGKYGHYIYPGKEFCGKLFIEDISIPEKVIKDIGAKRAVLCKEEINLKNRDYYINKGSAGKVLIIAGKKGYSGAAYMCSEACLRAGAGLVFLAIPDSINSILECKTTEVITIPLKDGENGNLTEESFEEIEKTIRENRIKTILIGPGIGREEESLTLVRKVITNIDAKIVIDADALFAIKDCMEIINGKDVVITPHEGEFERITGKKIERRAEEAEDLADKYGITVILKGAATIITNGKKTYINSTGNTGLSKGGSGDVLAGIIAAFISRGYTMEESSSYSVYLHGYIADRIVKEKSYESVRATDLIEKIGEVFKEFEKRER